MTTQHSNEAFIVYAKRTPIGKLGGQLASFRVDDLMAAVLKDIKDAHSFDPMLIDDVIVGCANQAGEDNRNLARMALLLADYPYEVPGTTVNRLCGSSLDALSIGHAKIKAGLADCLVIGGAESMTRGPYVLSKSESAFDRGQKMFDTTFGWRFTNPKMEQRFPLLSMGETAEEVAMLHHISREKQDEFALLSHQKASSAILRGDFSHEIIPLTHITKKETITISKDECPRANTTLEALLKLSPVFKKAGTVTAGNSSPMNDGAAGLLLVSEKFLKTHSLTPVMRISGASVMGIHPSVMGLGPVSAINHLLKRNQKKISDYNIFELNEAFAAQALGCLKELEIDPTLVNKNGGAIALGHPLGASGARIVTTLFHQMQKNAQLKHGIASMCIGVGQGIAMSFERV